MYQDTNQHVPCDIPPCDCLPDRNYPENPDWLWFFSEWKKIMDSVGNLPELEKQVEENVNNITTLTAAQKDSLLKSMQAVRTSDQVIPVGVDKQGKLWVAASTGNVLSVNGQTGEVVLTAKDVNALPADTLIPPAYKLPIATDTRLGGVRPNKKTPDMVQIVGVDADGRLYTAPSGDAYKLPQATAQKLGGVKANPVTEEQTQPVGIDAGGKLFTAPIGSGSKEVDVYDFPPMPIPKGIQLFVDESEDPLPLPIPTKVSQLENDAQYEESQTIKVDTKLSGVTSIETLRTFLYTQRKAVSRKAQFEISPGGVNAYLIDILGYPTGATADDKAFLYIELPYSEAGGFEIRYRYQLRDKPGIWDRVDYGTLNSNWKTTEWWENTSCVGVSEYPDYDKQIIIFSGGGPVSDLKKEVTIPADGWIYTFGYNDGQDQIVALYIYTLAGANITRMSIASYGSNFSSISTPLLPVKKDDTYKINIYAGGGYKCVFLPRRVDSV